MTGWALFLDYLIVIALSALFLPHYLAGAFAGPRARPQPVGRVVGVGVIALVAGVRLVRRPSLYGFGILVPALDLADAAPARRARLRARLLAARADAAGCRSARTRPGTRSPSRCRSRCSRSPGSRRSRTSPPRRGAPASTCRGRSSAASPRSSRCTSRSPWSRSRRSPARTPSSARAGSARRCSASPQRIGSELPWHLGGALRFYVGVTGALILLRRRHDVDLGVLAPRLLAGRARPAAAELRSPQPPRARLAAGDHLRGGDLVGDRDRHLVHQRTTSRSSRACSRSACCSRSPPRSSR